MKVISIMNELKNKAKNPKLVAIVMKQDQNSFNRMLNEKKKKYWIYCLGNII